MAGRECNPQVYASGHQMESRNVDADRGLSDSKVVSSEVISSEVTSLARAYA